MFAILLFTISPTRHQCYLDKDLPLFLLLTPSNKAMHKLASPWLDRRCTTNMSWYCKNSLRSLCVDMMSLYTQIYECENVHEYVFRNKRYFLVIHASIPTDAWTIHFSFFSKTDTSSDLIYSVGTFEVGCMILILQWGCWHSGSPIFCLNGSLSERFRHKALIRPTWARQMIIVKNHRVSLKEPSNKLNVYR